MKTCKSIRTQWPDFLANTLPLDDRRIVDEHLASCPACQKEWALQQAIEAYGADLANTTEKTMASIPWETIPERILAQIDARRKEPLRLYFLRRLPLPQLIASTAALFLAIAFLWILHPRGGHPQSKEGPVSTATLDRWETSISRDQLLQYLSQSQLVLTGIFKQCQDAPPKSHDLYIQSQQVQSLLQKGKYLRSEFSRLELAKAEPVCRQLDLLFYDIVQLSPESACSDIERIQGMIKKENLFLKIRLLEKELTFPQEREA